MVDCADASSCCWSFQYWRVPHCFHNLEDISLAAAAQIPYASMLRLSILGKAESATAREMSVTSTQGVPMFAILADGSEASRKGP